jgi:hypothetical protein
MERSFAISLYVTLLSQLSGYSVLQENCTVMSFTVYFFLFDTGRVTYKEGTDTHRSNKKQSEIVIGRTHRKGSMILVGNVEIQIVGLIGTGCNEIC